jgi:hypothetical protein
MKLKSQYEFRECLEAGAIDRAIEIAEANQETYEQEAQRWADLLGEALLKKAAQTPPAGDMT